MANWLHKTNTEISGCHDHEKSWNGVLMAAGTLVVPAPRGAINSWKMHDCIYRLLRWASKMLGIPGLR